MQSNMKEDSHGGNEEQKSMTQKTNSKIPEVCPYQ